MAKTIKYNGAQQRWPELSITGKQSNWMPGQQEERSDSEAGLLLGTGQFTEIFALDDLPLASLVSGGGKSVNGGNRAFLSAPLPPADGTAGAAKTFDVQVASKKSRGVKAIRWMYSNYNKGAVANYTAARVGASPKHRDAYGTEVTWNPDLANIEGNTNMVADIAGAADSGTATQTCEGFSKWTEWMPVTEVARTDMPTGRPLFRIRSRSAAEVQMVYNVAGTFVAAWNAYVGADGPVIASYMAGGDFATAAPTDAVYYLTENGGNVQPVIVQFLYTVPGIQLWAFGDSLFQGAGSSVGPSVHNGVLGWPTLIDLQQQTIDVINMGVSGQKTRDSLIRMKRMIRSGADSLPNYVAIKCYSPNDGAPTQALTEQVWALVTDAVEFLIKKGITPILFTSPPVNSWNATQHGWNEIQNAKVDTLIASSGRVKKVDFCALVRDPANARQLNPTYLYTGDAAGTHIVDAGYQVVANATVPLLV